MDLKGRLRNFNIYGRVLDGHTTIQRTMGNLLISVVAGNYMAEYAQSKVNHLGVGVASGVVALASVFNKLESISSSEVLVEATAEAQDTISQIEVVPTELREAA